MLFGGQGVATPWQDATDCDRVGDRIWCCHWSLPDRAWFGFEGFGCVGGDTRPRYLLLVRDAISFRVIINKAMLASPKAKSMNGMNPQPMDTPPIIAAPKKKIVAMI